MGLQGCIRPYRYFAESAEWTVNPVQVLDAFEMLGICLTP